MIKFEGHYLLGLPIDLKEFNLGIIHPITYKDLVLKNIDLSVLLKPFLMKKEMIKGEDDEFNNTIDKIGNLGFLFYIDNKIEDLNIIDKLLNSLKILYVTDDVYVNPITNYIHVKEIIIDVEKFDILSDIVAEMFKIKKQDVEVDEIKDDFDKQMAMKREQAKKKSKKKKDNQLEFEDIVNIIIHSNEGCLNYNNVMNMTIYQIKNTYETLSAKEDYYTYTQYKLHQFDIKNSIQDWRSKKIIQKSLIKQID